MMSREPLPESTPDLTPPRALQDEDLADLFPPSLPVIATLSRREDAREWLAGLPRLVAGLRDRWSLRLGRPYHGGSCSWVAPVRLHDGASAVLKVCWPHREAAGEGEALRLWDGNGAVRVLRDDPQAYALLLERCDPGSPLGAADHLPAEERLLIGAALLNQLWCPPPSGTLLEPLGAVTAEWADVVETRMDRLRPGFDPGLVAHGAALLRTLPATASRTAVLHGDFNPGNVLAARRRPWLTIDAKPMVGDPAYDPWPLLEQIDDPFRHPDPPRVLSTRFALVADAVGEDPRRLPAWAVARRVEAALWGVAHGYRSGPARVMNEARTLAALTEV
ncbi:aminoglycoside phosphotransferase family protein [Sphaerisporangium sp. B11E5]|uniref:aminoglycoside phosphotransferase family protein n=1 Tax=Sphaerisporangium sp. B11E5 TaxID=3153563 RepID=UPI00325C7DC2